MKYLFVFVFSFVFSLTHIPALACNDPNSDTNIYSKYDEEIKRIKKLGVASIELVNKEIEMEITENPIVWVQSGDQEFDAYVNQGIAFLHVLHYIDALRSFKMAHNINPCSLYPVTGMILSYIHLSKNSIPFIQKLLLTSKGLVESAEEKEKLWYDLAVSIFVFKAGLFLQQEYQNVKVPRKAYSDLLAFNPNDIETLTLASLMIDLASEDKLLKALEIQPHHIGANHFLIHLKEGMGKSTEALEYARNFSKYAPYSAHAVHMLAHVLPETGNWSEAKRSFQRANEIHLDWAQRNEVNPIEDWHYPHNLHLLSITHIALGEFEEAHQILKNSCFVNQNIHACFHFYLLYNIMEDPDNAQALYDHATSEHSTLSMYLKKPMDEIKLLKGVSFDELPLNSQQSPHLILVNKIVQSRQIEDPALKQKLISEIQSYILNNFPQRGFDSWANGIINALRILSVTARIKDKEMYEVALSAIKEKTNEFDFDLYNHIESIKNLSSQNKIGLTDSGPGDEKRKAGYL